MQTPASTLVKSLFTSFLATAAVWGQTLPPLPSEANPTHIQAELTTAVKSAKAKVGDKLKATTMTQVDVPNGPSIPAGSTIMGQVQKVDGASVTLAFDQVNVDGKKIPLDMTLVAAALMGGAKTQTTEGSGGTRMDRSGRPLSGGGQSATEAAGSAATGAADPTLSPTTVQPGGAVRTTAGSVVGLPGVTLAVDEEAPFASRFELKNKEQQLPKGLQLMFTVRQAPAK